MWILMWKKGKNLVYLYVKLSILSIGGPRLIFMNSNKCPTMWLIKKWDVALSSCFVWRYSFSQLSIRNLGYLVITSKCGVSSLVSLCPFTLQTLANVMFATRHSCVAVHCGQNYQILSLKYVIFSRLIHYECIQFYPTVAMRVHVEGTDAFTLVATSLLFQTSTESWQEKHARQGK